MGGGGFGGGHPRQQQQPAHNLYDDSPVIELHGSNWAIMVVGRDDSVVVNFYSPGCGHCTEIKDDYIKLAKTFSGIVNIASVNCARHRQMCQEEGIKGYPTIKYYSEDPDTEGVAFKGDAKNSKSLGKWISQKMTDNSSVLRSMPQTASWLQEGGGKKAKVILFTDKKSVPPLLKMFSRIFAGSISFGVFLNPSKEVSEKLKVPKLPSVLYVHHEETFEGEWLDKTISKDVLSLFLSRVRAHHSRTSQGTFKRLSKARMASGDCRETDSQFCIIMIKHGQRPDIDQTLTQFGEKFAEQYKSDPVKVVWVSEQEREFLLKFGVSGCSIRPDQADDFSQCPLAIAYRPKKKKFSIFQGSLQQEILNSWIENIISGGSMLPSRVKEEPIVLS